MVRDTRPPIPPWLGRHYDLDRLDNRDEAFIASLVDRIEPFVQAWFRPDVRGLDRVRGGKALLVGNHNGGAITPDAYVFAVALFRARGIEDLPHGLAHDAVLRMPGFHQAFARLGAVRAAPENAARLFAAGKKVMVYPGGDVEALRPYRDRDRIVFGARRGYVRTALEHRVPLIPVVSAGAHETFRVLTDGRRAARVLGLDRRLRFKSFPVTFSIPWGLTIGPPPPYLPLPTRILIEVLEPIRFRRWGARAAADADYVEQCHERVVTAMQDTLTRLARERAKT